MEKNDYGSEQIAKVKGIHSIRTRMIALIITGILIAVVSILINVIPKSRAAIESAIQSNMYDLATSYMDLLDKSVEASGQNTLSTQELTDILSKVQIRNVKSSFLFLVDETGKILYNPDTERIGVISDNSLVVEITQAIKNGDYKKSDIREYVSTDGVEKYASYAVSDKTHWTIIVTAEKTDILSPIRNITNTAIISAVVIVLLLAIIGYVFATSVIGPISSLTRVVRKTSELDFSKDEVVDKLSKRKDETGIISRMTVTMQENLRDMVVRIESAADKLVANAGDLSKLAVVIDDACSDNSATSEELAASMEETSATAETIDSNVSQIRTGMEDINQKSIEGLDMAKKIMQRAQNLQSNSMIAKDDTTTIYNSVKEKSTQAIEQSKAVDKINVLSSTIQEIAEQTSLLSLNASIEAARAGDSGKGFAVVAGEIGNLANQSSTTVNSILDIVAEVHQAVDSMSDCLKTTLEFLEKKVMVDYNGFVDVSMKYSTDANNVEQSMKDINYLASALEDSSQEIAIAISGINKTIG
ncbi:MAG TPA: methyl-accepting chemotaxis protein, partial [Lachnospiraceae bacterium]|nr:methyl-accepting chemotaxis protein [Lachnospiraceae bacterium]